ncbi:hypothetical protein Ancab_023402 [Ancistrocladus abbreviatus]
MEKQSLSHNKPNPNDLVAYPHLLESHHIWGVLKAQFTEEGRSLCCEKPDHNDHVNYARWLASKNIWGVINDGLPGDGYGVPYFYLTLRDLTAINALKDSRSSLSISELPLGTSGNMDPENLTCGKMTLTGRLKKLESGSEEVELGRKYLFSKHPEMQYWPPSHGFEVFKLDIEDIYLLNWYGPATKIPVEEYLKWKM